MNGTLAVEGEIHLQAAVRLVDEQTAQLPKNFHSFRDDDCVFYAVRVLDGVFLGNASVYRIRRDFNNRHLCRRDHIAWPNASVNHGFGFSSGLSTYSQQSGPSTATLPSGWRGCFDFAIISFW